MNREEIKRFVELVDSGAQLKSYRRELKLDVNAYKYHLTRLHYYRQLLEEDEKKVESVSVTPPVVKSKKEKTSFKLEKDKEDEKLKEPKSDLKEEEKDDD